MTDQKNEEEQKTEEKKDSIVGEKEGKEEMDNEEDEEDDAQKIEKSFKIESFRDIDIFRRLADAFIGRRGRLTNFFKYVAKMDANGDGVISLEEFSSCVRKVFKGQQDCPPKEEIEDIYHSIDENGEGKIPICHFLTLLRGPMNQERLMYINMAFDKLDESEDGFIDAKEALSYFYSGEQEDKRQELENSKEEARKFIMEFDTKEVDGRVSWQEFHEFYWNMSITCKSDEEFITKITETWSLSEEEINYFTESWIPPDVFPQKFPLYASGASAVDGVRISPDLLGANNDHEEGEEQETESQLKPSKPEVAKPSFESPRATTSKDGDVVSMVQALQEENAALKVQLQQLQESRECSGENEALRAQLHESRKCADKLLAILSR